MFEQQAYPPTLFVHMPRDGRTAGLVAAALDALAKAGAPAAEIRVDPRPVTAAWLSRQSALIPVGMAQAIVAALKANHLVDKAGFLVSDPRSTNWQDPINPHVGDLSLAADESQVSGWPLPVAASVPASHRGTEVVWLGRPGDEPGSQSEGRIAWVPAAAFSLPLRLGAISVLCGPGRGQRKMGLPHQLLHSCAMQVSELLNVAYAMHEIVSDTTEAMLAWLEAGGKLSVDEVQQQLKVGSGARRRLA